MATLTILQSDTFEDSQLSYSGYLGLVADVIAIIIAPFYIIDGITTTKQLDKPRDKRQKRWDRTEPQLPPVLSSLAPETTFILDRCPTYHSQIMEVYNEPRPSTSKQSKKRSSTLLNMIKNKNTATIKESEKKEEKVMEQDYNKTNEEDSRETTDKMLLSYPEMIALQPLTEKNDFENKPEVMDQETKEIRDTDIDIFGIKDVAHNEILDKNQDEKQEFSNEKHKTADVYESESTGSKKKKKKKKKQHKAKKHVKEETVDTTNTEQMALSKLTTHEKEKQPDFEKSKTIDATKPKLEELVYDKSAEEGAIGDALLLYPEVPALQQSENNIVHFENKQKYKPDTNTGIVDTGILDKKREKQEDSKEAHTNEDMDESTGSKKKKKKHHKKKKKEETTDQTITEQTYEKEERTDVENPRVVELISSKLEEQVYDKITKEPDVNEISHSEEMRIEDKSERKNDKSKKKKKKKKDELPHFFEDFVVRYKTEEMPESTELSFDHLLQESETATTTEETIKITEKPIPQSTINQRVLSGKFRMNKI
ncbi:glutamic acid-rich protein-like [Mytilus californianus]|uniref:glutamic acid-rich protein-like n=1 Tax=Mytilus californianus TaxID=6549 RepID=UPI0022473AF6|nr:glutamic acid-rich protein-like [Mytilus californianus]